MWEMLGSLASGVMNYFGGEKNRDTQMQIAQQNIASQREFAQQGLGWRVEDAVRHGLSPLVGAGVQPGSFSPVSVGDVGGGMAAAGQDLGRAVKAIGTLKERSTLELEEHHNAVEQGRLQNDLLRTELVSKIRRENAAVGPPLPGDWQDFAAGGRAPKRSGSGVALDDDKMKQKEESAPAVRSLPLFGMPWKTYPGRASAQDIENEYGDEGLSTVLSNMNIPVDVLYNLGQSGAWKRWEELMKWNAWQELRGGDRSRWSRAQRTMREGGRW